MMFLKVEISKITKSSLNLAETKFYEVGPMPPCFLGGLETLNLVCYLVTPKVIVRCPVQKCVLEPRLFMEIIYLSHCNSNTMYIDLGQPKSVAPWPGCSIPV